MNVNLREKKLTNGRRSLYLDFYPPIISEGKQTRREFLKLYVYEKPKTELERNHNSETRQLAETLRSTRQLDLQANPHGFVSQRRRHGDFLGFFRKFIEQKKNHSAAAVATWEAIFNHLNDFCGGRCAFSQIDAPFIERFRGYLLTCEPRQSNPGKSRRPAKNATLSRNTAKSYFERFVSVVRHAREENYLSSDPTAKVKPIKGTTPQREFLSVDELQTLAKTPCEMPDNLRRAALFSALTGLRHSDIVNLKWKDVRGDAANGTALNLMIKKTDEHLLLPISDEALELLGDAGNQGEQVFAGLEYAATTGSYIKRWAEAAGILRRITFHSFRRTFATAQITAGTDIYTVSKMLGHSSIAQTQIYAQLLDEKKREAAGKITLK